MSEVHEVAFSRQDRRQRGGTVVTDLVAAQLESRVGVGRASVLFTLFSLAGFLDFVRIFTAPFRLLCTDIYPMCDEHRSLYIFCVFVKKVKPNSCTAIAKLRKPPTRRDSHGDPRAFCTLRKRRERAVSPKGKVR